MVSAVLSGNRNFEARIHPLIRANYLASPMLVVAYALAGRVDIDLYNEPLGHDRDGKPVFLADIWPTQEEIRETVASALKPEMYRERYGEVFEGDEHWQALPLPEEGNLYEWADDSTYVRRPPFFEQMSLDLPEVADIRRRARARAARSVGHDRPHLAGRRHSQERAGGPLPEGARRRGEGLQHLRLPPREPRGDDARDVRQRAYQEPAARREGGRLHAPLPHRGGDPDLRRVDAVPGRPGRRW